MAEEQIGTRKDYLKELAPWTKLFTAFKIALDPKKLVLAGAGLLVMALGWYMLSVIFFSLSTKPDEKDYPDLQKTADPVKRDATWKEFKRDRERWNLLYEMAGTPTLAEKDMGDGKKILVPKEVVEIADRATTLQQYDANAAPLTPGQIYKPYGRFRIMPWFEDRGANPYLLVTKNANAAELEGKVRAISTGESIVSWFLTEQLPVLLEPLVKFYQPIIYLFKPEAGFLNRLYLFLVILWSLATWAFFGGAITRIAAVQVARANERVSLKEAVKFVCDRYRAYLTAPIFPLLFLAALTVVLIIFGLAEGNLWFVGDILGSLLWPLVLLVGLIMAVVLVGLIGWPLMYTTISAEGSDSFDAISRSYSYVYQAPWHYLWYAFVALVYGAVLVFFVGLMGSLMVYTSKWAVSLAPTAEEREPSYLYRWAPTSFGWRDLLLNKSPHAELQPFVNTHGHLQMVTEAKVDKEPYLATWNNNIGAFIVSVWLYLLFLMIVGFGYSYFWTASTIIYLLMRLKVDDTEMDEIHIEEEPEQPFPPPGVSPPPSPSAAEPPKGNQQPLQMVESPQLRTPPPAPTPVVVAPPPVASGPGSPALSTSPNPPSPSAEPMQPPPRTDGPMSTGGM